MPSFEQLNLPPGVKRLAEEHRGLVLVTGATGSGKTTTLASMIDHINRTRHQHIVTIEDPIEILHPDRNCIVNQREVGLDTESFAQALRRVLRQDPDTILIGELRDAETAQTALQAAESGHLVFSTLHTIDAAETVGRMIEFFPPAKQQQIRSVLAGVLRGVISQRLLPRVDGGRVAAVEVMVMNARIADLIREERTEEIPDAVAEGALLRDADLPAGADRARARGQRRPRGRRERLLEPPRLPRRARPRRSSSRHADVAQVQAARGEAAAEEATFPRCVSSAPPGRDARALARRRSCSCSRSAPERASADTFAVVPETLRTCVARTAPSRSRPRRCPTSRARCCCRPRLSTRRSCRSRELAYEELHALWLRAGGAYGIPWQVLAAINKIESNFGRNMGPSSAGAVGWMQFMPDTWLRWGMDASGDGIADPWNADDAVYSAARYLAAAGGRTDISRGIFAYNHAQWYVDDVLELAAVFGGGGGADVVFTLDRMSIALEDAQEQVASLSEQLDAAESRETELTAGADALAQRGREPRPAPLRPDPSRRRKPSRPIRNAPPRAPRSSASAPSWRRRRLRSRPSAAAPTRRRSRPRRPRCSGCRPARTATSSRSAAAPASSPSATTTTTTPLRTSPRRPARRCSRSPTPSCSALADDGGCGTGLTFRSLDGLDWIYCHLSFRDPDVQPGALVTAGQWVGLVGSTGHSTGPHLHLGLKPARYPQEMPWFQEFAGLAFTWQDESAGAGSPNDADLLARPRSRPISPPKTSSNSPSTGVEFVARSADIPRMTAGVFGRMPRAAAIACGVGLFTATITFAASSTLSAPTTPPATPVAAAPEPLVVPDVRKQAYVFAKGTLEQDGFAWRVEGGVAGFAANVVVSQSPAPGTRVVPDGAPIVVLRLSRNGAYKQEGMPENVSPYPGKAARLVGATKPKPQTAQPAAAAKPAAPAKPAAQARRERRPPASLPSPSPARRRSRPTRSR